MGISRFESGQAIVVDDARFNMHRKLPNGEWQLEHQETGELRNMPIGDLEKALVSGKIRFVQKESAYPLRTDSPFKIAEFQTFDSLPQKKKEEARFRLHFVRELIREGAPARCKAYIQPKLEAAWGSLPKIFRNQPVKPKWLRRPSWSSVYRWHKRYMDAGQDILALVPWVHLRGSTKRVTNCEILDIVEDAITAVYMKRERGTIQATMHWAVSEICRRNRTRLEGGKLKIPGKSLVSRLIQAIPYVDRLISRYGEQFARKKLRNVTGHYVAERILEFVQLDATVFDSMVVDDETLLPLGRPWITVAIDLRSRCVHGIHIGFTPPSTSSVFACLRQGFLPKATLRDEYPEIHNSWDCHGVPETLVLDNGMENHSAELKALADRFNIIIQYCPRKQPWFKPHIERFIGTLNRAVAHKLPGTTFADIFEKDDYDPAKNAVITLSGLRKLIFKWIADDYHQSLHRVLHDTPANVWRDSPGSDNPYVPDNPFELQFMFSRTDTRMLTHKGIEFYGLPYNSDALGDLRNRYGAEFEVTIRYDAEDLGAIFVVHPNGQSHIRVDASDTGYACGLSLWLHKKIRRYARKYKDGRVDLETLVESKREIAEIIEREFKFARRKAKSRGKDVARARTAKSATQPARATPVPAVGALGQDDALEEMHSSIPSAAAREREIQRLRQRTH